MLKLLPVCIFVMLMLSNSSEVRATHKSVQIFGEVSGSNPDLTCCIMNTYIHTGHSELFNPSTHIDHF